MFNLYLALEQIENEKERELVEQLYLTYARRVKKLAYRILCQEEDAEDVVGEVFKKVIRYREKFMDSERDRTTNLIVIYTRSVCFDMQESKKRKPTISMNRTIETKDGDEKDMDLPADIDVLQEVVKNEMIDKLRTAIRKLDYPAKDMICLKYFHGMRNREIAEMLNMNASTVSTVLERTLKKMRKMLEG